MASIVVPVIKQIEINPDLMTGDDEIAVLLRNPHVNAITKLSSFHSFLPSENSRAEVTAKIDASANIELSFCIDGTETIKINSHCIPASTGTESG